MATYGEPQKDTSGVVNDSRLANRRLLIAYGSETGNSHDAAETLERLAERLRFQVHLCEMNDITFKILQDYSLAVFVVSTTGQGEIPRNARRFWKSLLRKQLPPDCLAAVQFTTFGLGDSSYSKFNWAARKLHKRVEQLGGQEFFSRGEGDERHDDGIDGTFIPWYTRLQDRLLSTFPLPEDLPPISADVRLPPKYTIELVQHASEESTTQGSTTPVTEAQSLTSSMERLLDHMAASVSHADAVASKKAESELQSERLRPQDDNTLVRQIEESAKQVSGGVNVLDRPSVLEANTLKHAGSDNPELRETAPPAHLLPIPASIEAVVTRNERLTPLDHWQDVRSMSLTVETPNTADDQSMASPINPGTVVTIYPKNFLSDVQLLIDLMDWGDVADKPFEHHSRLNLDSAQPPQPKGCYPLSHSTLRDLLINNYDITAIPKRIFFEMIAWHSKDETHQERLREFADPRYTDEFYDYTSRPRRSILEILHDFESVKIPVQEVPSIFPVIRGREYSIASGGPISQPAPGILQVDVLVALVKYKTILRKVRQGLCSRYLASLDINTIIKVNISQPNRGPPTGLQNIPRPLLAIAPGTGVAPMRSLIWERHGIRHSHGTVTSKDFLVFGGRNESADFFYKDEWKRLEVEVYTAFSRDQREKIYVQDVIRKNGSTVCDIIRRGGIVCLCGSSGRMPEAVRLALCDVMVEGKVYPDEQAAKKFFDDPRVYWEEVW